MFGGTKSVTAFSSISWKRTMSNTHWGIMEKNIMLHTLTPPSYVSKSLVFNLQIWVDKLGPARKATRFSQQTCMHSQEVTTEKGTKLETLKTSKLTSPLQAETTCRAAVLWAFYLNGSKNNYMCCNFFLALALPGSVSNQGHVFIAYFLLSHSTFSLAPVNPSTACLRFII